MLINATTIRFVIQQTKTNRYKCRIPVLEYAGFVIQPAIEYPKYVPAQFIEVICDE